MSLLRLIPKIFYSDIRVGKHLFVDAMNFDVVYDDGGTDPFLIVKRDNVTVHLLQNDEFARKDRPEIRIATDTIDEVYADIARRCPDVLHPNGNKVTLKPWGLREFALRDASDVCIIFEQSADPS